MNVQCIKQVIMQIKKKKNKSTSVQCIKPVYSTSVTYRKPVYKECTELKTGLQYECTVQKTGLQGKLKKKQIKSTSLHCIKPVYNANSKKKKKKD